MTAKRILSVVPDASKSKSRKTKSTKPKPRKTKPRKPKLYTVTDAAAKGSRRDLLVSMRGRIATAVEDGGTPARDLAALTRRLMEIAKEIDSIDAITKQEATENDTPADEAFSSTAI